MNEKHSVRWEATDRQIRAIALALLRKTPLEHLSVRTICEQAGVNRTTFYLHFQDVYDLFRCIEIDMFKRLIASFPQDTRLLSRASLLQFFRFAKEERAFYTVALRTRGLRPAVPSIHVQEFQLLMEMLLRQYMQREEMPDSAVSYGLCFFQGGFLLTLQRWLDGGCRESEEEMADLVVGCIPDAIRSLIHTAASSPDPIRIPDSVFDPR